ncbi:MAG: hypothetical protein PUB18_00275 [bacterium]|nr:hypothetical protein [bacterium]
MELEDQFRLLVGGYYGMVEMDEYNLKVHILKEIENNIQDFIATHPITNFNYQEEAMLLESLPLKRKLQDCLLVLHKINAPVELTLLVRKKLNELEGNVDFS